MPSRSKPSAPTPQLWCVRPKDCRCWKPLDDGQACPREHESCICRWTWRDTKWSKGDNHAQCPIQHEPAEDPEPLDADPDS